MFGVRKAASEFVDGLHEVLRETERLKAENAKLREQVTRLQADWESERDYADQMETKEQRAVAENDKLKKMCADMLVCINAKKARKLICWECEHHRDVDELRSVCFLVSDARSLGIEVDE